MQGVPKIYLRNAVPVEKAGEFVDGYEITPAYSYEWDEKNHRTRKIWKKLARFAKTAAPNRKQKIRTRKVKSSGQAAD